MNYSNIMTIYNLIKLFIILFLFSILTNSCGKSETEGVGTFRFSNVSGNEVNIVAYQDSAVVFEEQITHHEVLDFKDGDVGHDAIPNEIINSDSIVLVFDDSLSVQIHNPNYIGLHDSLSFFQNFTFFGDRGVQYEITKLAYTLAN